MKTLLTSILTLTSLVAFSQGFQVGVTNYTGFSLQPVERSLQQDVPSDVVVVQDRKWLSPNIELGVGLYVVQDLSDYFHVSTGVNYVGTQYYQNLLSTPGLPDPVIGGPIMDDPNCPLTTLNRRRMIEIPLSFGAHFPLGEKLDLLANLGISRTYKYDEIAIAVMTGEQVELLSPSADFSFTSFKGSLGISYELCTHFQLRSEIGIQRRRHWFMNNPTTLTTNVSIGYKI